MPQPARPDQASPTNPLMDVIATVLTSLFIAAGCTDTALARQAALETVASHRPRNQADLLIVAQMISFSFAALAASAAAVTGDLPAPAMDRLLARVAALNLAAARLERSRARIDAEIKATDKEREDQTEAAEAQAAHARAQASLDAARPAPSEPPKPKPKPKPKPDPAPASADQAKRRYLGNMLNTVAERFIGELPNLPPAERKEHALRAELTSGVARALLDGQPWDVISGMRAPPK